MTTYTFQYADGDVLSIRDEGVNAVAEVESLYFLSSCSSSPTASPTAAPSGWWQANDVPNVTEIYARLQGAETSLVNLTATVTAQSTAINAVGGEIYTLVNVMNSSNANYDAQISSIASVAAAGSTQASTVATQVPTLTAALANAISTAAVGGGLGPPPALSVSSSGSLGVTSGQCMSTDLCGASSFASNLKSNLAALNL